MTKYYPTIGIECHVQLKTRTKLFSSSDNDARGAVANTRVNEIDFALPGMLPYLNKEAVRLAVRAAKALNADVARESRFDRKHYFYPDLPKGYQISQMYMPLILAGRVELPNGHSVRIEHAHLEEDAGKLTHFSDHSEVDLNRAGTPLIEIVSEPDIHSAEDARLYAEELHRLMTFADVTYGDLYEGNMRFDVNVSVSPDPETLGTRAEIKNLNSFRSVEAAVEYEIKRQSAVLEDGGKVVQETRGFVDATGETTAQRSKEEAQDYRYMPDADIPPVILTDEKIKELQSDFPKMPAEYRAEFAELGVDDSVINVLLSAPAIARTMSEVIETSDAKIGRKIANLIATNHKTNEEVPGQQPTDTAISSDDLVELGKMLIAGDINSNAGDKIFAELTRGGIGARKIAEKMNLIQTNDTGAIEKIVEDVLVKPEAAKAVADIKGGNAKAIGFLVGLVMKESKGKANPGLATKIINEKIGG